MTLESLRFGVATASLGMAPGHSLQDKLAALQAAGFHYCALNFDGYMTWLRARRPDLPPSTAPAEYNPEAGEPDPSDDALWEAVNNEAANVVQLAASHGIKIIVLQPLNQYDGWTPGTARHDWVRRKAQRWVAFLHKLGVEQLQVGSNDYASATATDEETAEDMRYLAEVASQVNPPVKIAYENWSFSERLASWEHAWKVVQLADHPNLGLCLDTGHFPLTPDYGWDPTTGKGWTDKEFRAMLGRIRQVPAEKIFYVELSDVLEPVVPLDKGSPFDAWKAETKPTRNDRFVWAVCGRPLPLVGRDAGRGVKDAKDLGGARVVEALEAILDTGFNGPLIFEFFEAISMAKSDKDVPLVYARAAALSQQRLIQALQKAQ